MEHDRIRTVLGTAGHIDHGKTALVRALTGTDTDRLPEEKGRGITIALGFATLDPPAATVGNVDVPGHERVVKNMLAGAGGIDLAMLTVAADDAVMPQTREHLDILQLLGIPRGVVAITKADLATEDWLALIEDDIRELTRGTFLESAPIVRTSATTGAGIDTLRDTIASIAAGVRRQRDDAGFRMPIDRVFTRKGHGTVVTGTVWSGRVSTEHELTLMPAGRTVTVRGLHAHNHEQSEIAAGQRAAINLRGVETDDIARGDELCARGNTVATRLVTVHLRTLPDSPITIRHRSRVRLHMGARETMATVRLLRDTAIEPGEAAPAQLLCAEPVVARGQQPFVVRAESPVVTVGGGTVLLPEARPIPRRRTDLVERLEALRSTDPAQRIDTAALMRGAAPFSVQQLARDAGVPADKAAARADALIQISAHGDRLIHPETFDAVTARIARTLRALHNKHPRTPLVQEPALAARLPGLDSELIDHALGLMAERSDVRRTDRGIALASFEPSIPKAAADALERVVGSFEAAGFSPPSVRELADPLGERPETIEIAIEVAAGDGLLSHIGGGVLLHADRERELRERVVAALSGGDGKAGMTVAQIRDLLGTSRKHAVPICEHLDRVGVTRRTGDVRVRGHHGERAARSTGPGAASG